MILFQREDLYVPIHETKAYNGIDLIKFICAILVLMIHIPPFLGDISETQQWVNFILQHIICRVAVPFYFISSGFFLFRKMPLYRLDKEIIKTYCFKILRLLGTWHVLLFAGATGHLWYLGATVISIILLSLCFHFRIKMCYIYVIACALYVIGLLGDSYYGIIAPLENIRIFGWIFEKYRSLFDTTRNGVFMGFVFVLMGAVFSNCKIVLRTRTALIGFAVSMLCLVAEGLLLDHHDIPNEYNMYVFLLPAAFCLFSFAASLNLKNRHVYRHLRNVGMLIYFTHLLVGNFTILARDNLSEFCGIDLTQYLFAASLLFTLLFSLLVDWLSNKDRFKWIHWVLS